MKIFFCFLMRPKKDAAITLILLCVFAKMMAQELTFATEQEWSTNVSAVMNVTDEQAGWDFGQVKEGEVLVHEFKLKNTSSRMLRIQSLFASCGCTVAEIEKKSLLPGETVTIKVQFNSHGYSGEVRQFVYLNTDDVDRPQIRYIIKAKVEK